MSKHSAALARASGVGYHDPVRAPALGVEQKPARRPRPYSCYCSNAAVARVRNSIKAAEQPRAPGPAASVERRHLLADRRLARRASVLLRPLPCSGSRRRVVAWHQRKPRLDVWTAGRSIGKAAADRCRCRAAGARRKQSSAVANEHCCIGRPAEQRRVSAACAMRGARRSRRLAIMGCGTKRTYRACC